MATESVGEVSATESYRHLGKSRVTQESKRFVQGRGRYLADLRLPGMLHVAMVRSPHAHARIIEIDTTEASGMPGVHAVLTGKQAAELSGPAFTLAAFHDPPLPVPMRALACDRARFAGEGVVAVAATSRSLAEDAAAKITVQYELLPTISNSTEALAPGATLVHDDLPNNILLTRHYDFGPVDEVFAQADRIVRRRLSWSRQTGAALDTFGCIAQWDDDDGDLTVWSNHQSHALLWTLGSSLGIPPQRVRGIACDIGGSFGAKFWQPRPVLVCAMLSRLTGRPVRFIEDRVESLVSGDNHGEDRTYDAELAVAADGTFLGLRFDVVEDYGSAFLLGAINNAEPLAQGTGPYDIKALGFTFTGVVTNKTPQAAYRGFGGAAMNFLLERLADAAASELGRDRFELRRQNLIPEDAFPYRTPLGNEYDSGRYEMALDQALELVDLATWRRRQQEAREQGRAIGIGIATCQERSVQAGSALWVMFDQSPHRSISSAESVTARIDTHGQVRVALHSPSLGTPLQTVAATIMAEELGVDPNAVAVSILDSQIAGPGLGPTASRMTVMLAGAVQGAAEELREQMRRVAAEMLEASPADLKWDAGNSRFELRGVPERHVTMAAIAHRAHTASLELPAGQQTGLEATFSYDHPFSTRPEPDGSSWGVFCPITGHSVHIPVVEVDVETGEVTFLDYAVVHDCGTVVNPDGVRGQVIGGIVQGVGSALSEELDFGKDGHLRQRDFRSYFVPTTLDVPRIRMGHLETPSPYTRYGVKGIGEGGRMAAPAAVVSAIEDALSPWSIRLDSVPVTPERILDLLADAQTAETTLIHTDQ